MKAERRTPVPRHPLEYRCYFHQESQAEVPNCQTTDSKETVTDYHGLEVRVEEQLRPRSECHVSCIYRLLFVKII